MLPAINNIMENIECATTVVVFEWENLRDYGNILVIIGDFTNFECFS
jgi:hypothetical protein